MQRLTRRAVLGVCGSLALSCHRSARLTASDRGRDFEVVDLTHPLGPSSPYLHVRGATFPFSLAPIASIEERGVYANRWELTEHIGTHIDAPCHFAAGAACLDELSLTELFAHVVVIDVEQRAASDPDAEVTVGDLAAWRSVHGPFPSRSAVLLSSGWHRRWPVQARFANEDAAGVMHFPGFSRDAVAELAATPAVLGIGTDTFSIDPGRDARYEGHRVLASAGKWALECLAQVDCLPARGARLFIGAPRVERASGGPARVIAWVPRSTVP